MATETVTFEVRVRTSSAVRAVTVHPTHPAAVKAAQLYNAHARDHGWVGRAFVVPVHHVETEVAP